MTYFSTTSDSIAKYCYRLFQLAIVLRFVTDPYPIVERFKDEENFEDPLTKKKKKFPGLKEDCSVNLSVVVPAYNEQERRKYLCTY